MADKTTFTAEEWSRLLSSPMIAGMAITAADPSGVWGLLKEGMAGGPGFVGGTSECASKSACKIDR